jgi:glycosyltransferase involved in cell wall biosynthesis
MKILHAFNQHRGGGGADNAARATIAVSRSHGLEVEVFTRSSEDLPRNLKGRWQAGTSVVYAPDSVKRFTALLDSFAPDVVHLHEVFPLVSPWILPPTTRRGVPVVMTCVDYRMTCPIVTHLRDGVLCTLCTGGREHWVVLKNCRQNLTESVSVALYNAMVRRLRLFHDHVDMFIAPSEFSREWLIEYARIDPARITTVSPLVEMPETPADAAAGSYVAFAGRFTPEKGVSTFLAAAELCRLPFAMARNEHAFATVPVPPGVDVVVTRGRDDLAAFYRGARMMVFPSLWFETFGLVGAEAMSHGIPVVASRLGAVANLVEDGVDGLLFEPGNAHDLAEKVTRLWNDPALCRRLGEEARRKAMALWSPQRHFERVFSIYRDLAPGPDSRPRPM